MVPKPLLIVLVYALPILIVAYAVLMGGFALALAVDPVAATVLRAIGLGCIVLLVIDLLLLVGALGVNSLADRNHSDRNDNE